MTWKERDWGQHEGRKGSAGLPHSDGGDLVSVVKLEADHVAVFSANCPRLVPPWIPPLLPVNDSIYNPSPTADAQHRTHSHCPLSYVTRPKPNAGKSATPSLRFKRVVFHISHPTRSSQWSVAMRGENSRDMVEESLADVARRRKAREPVEDVRGVNALLSKLRYVPRCVGSFCFC
jgi:hypothetical protein